MLKKNLRFANKRILFAAVVCLLISTNSVFAQRSKVDLEKHSATRATVFSAVLPGLGQAYNRNYWKIPVIYAGLGGIGYGLYFYQDYYQDFRSLYNKYRHLSPSEIIPETINNRNDYTLTNVREERDFARRWRDICIIGGTAWYLLNVLDAYVYANLFDFDVSDGLQVHVSPSLVPSVNARLNPGLNISFTF